MDDETQYRCAGYIQAEIERYAELLEDGDEESGVSQHSGGSDEDGDEDDGRHPTKAGKTRRREQVRNQGAPRIAYCEFYCSYFAFLAKLNSRDLLVREYLFIEIISTFLRAIRAGVVRIQHGAIVLAHYGRLEVAFDVCSKIIVDVLRQETVMKENPDIVVTVVTQALEEVCSNSCPESSILNHLKQL